MSPCQKTLSDIREMYGSDIDPEDLGAADTDMAEFSGERLSRYEFDKHRAALLGC